MFIHSVIGSNMFATQVLMGLILICCMIVHSIQHFEEIVPELGIVKTKLFSQEINVNTFFLIFEIKLHSSVPNLEYPNPCNISVELSANRQVEQNDVKPITHMNQAQFQVEAKKLCTQYHVIRLLFEHMHNMSIKVSKQLQKFGNVFDLPINGQSRNKRFIFGVIRKFLNIGKLNTQKKLLNEVHNIKNDMSS